jgi:hypothetical protein
VTVVSWSTILLAVAVPVGFHLTGWLVYFVMVATRLRWRFQAPDGCPLCKILLHTFCWEDDLVESLFSRPATDTPPADETASRRLVVAAPVEFARDRPEVA